MAYSVQSIIALAVALPLLADIAVALRFYVRLKLRPSYIGIDDWLAVFSGVLTSTIGALTIVGVVLGTQGRVYAEIPPERYIIQARVDFATLIVEKFLYGGMKLCMVFFFRRIFNAHRGFRIFSECIIGFLIAWTFAYVFAYLGSCTPLGIWFTPGAPRTPPHCVDVNSLNFSYAVTDPISDILVVVMPFPLIRRLHISHRERVGLVAIFLLGTLSTVASLLRLGFIAEAYAAQFGAGGNNHGSGVAPAVWSMIEGSIGVLAANLPPLGPLLRKGHVPHRLTALSSSIKDAFSRTRTTRKGSTATALEVAQQEGFGAEVHAVLGEANAAIPAAPATPATTSTGEGHHFPRNKSSFQSFV